MRRHASAPTSTTSGTEVVALAPDRARRFRTRILEWGAQHRRDLPWRHTRDPWKILVSEVMLQQTQVDRVVPHYERFVEAYPTPAACAMSGSADVVRRWSGLGYNRRALNLHRAATSIVEGHDGRVPSDDAALRALPGVGVYTARAVRSFGFGEDVAAVDTNGVRVLARAVAGSRLTGTAAFVLGDRLVPKAGSWEFNQSMFDLGATVCTARPDCGLCPLRRQCAWRRGGGEDPWRASPAARPQSAFSGSDRQGRGRLLESLRCGDVPAGEIARACGWPDDVARAERVAAALVEEGFAGWRGKTKPVLRLR
jgi:A/G-specific adenine glycosylase